MITLFSVAFLLFTIVFASSSSDDKKYRLKWKQSGKYALVLSLERASNKQVSQTAFKQFIVQRIDQPNVKPIDFYGNVIIQNVSNMTRIDQAKIILEIMLKKLRVDFSSVPLFGLALNIELSQDEVIYYYNSLIWEFNKMESMAANPDFRMVCMQHFALSISNAKLTKWVVSLSERDALVLLSEYFQKKGHPEGGFLIARELRKRSPDWNKLIVNLEREHYYNVFFKTYATKGTLSNIILTLDKHMQQVTTEITDLMSDHLISTVPAFSETAKDDIVAALDLLIKEFGYYNIKDPFNAISFKTLKDLFENQKRAKFIQILVPGKLQSEAYLLTQSRHLQAVLQLKKSKQSIYAANLNRILFGVGVRNRLISKYAYVSSLVDGVNNAMNFSNQLGNEISANTFLVVFDQSESSQILDENSLYLTSLNSPFIQIIHVNKQLAEELANSIGVIDMIKSNAFSYWGYAGSRNAVYFLAPVIVAAFEHHNCISVENVIELPRELKMSLLNTLVMNPQNNGSNRIVVGMGDFDSFVPSSKILDDLLDVPRVSQSYLLKSPFRNGRVTNVIDRPGTLPPVLMPFKVYNIAYSDKLEPTSMDGIISLPRFCLPGPFPNEELHDGVQEGFASVYARPLIHLCGHRWPLSSKEIFVSALHSLDLNALIERDKIELLSVFAGGALSNSRQVATFAAKSDSRIKSQIEKFIQLRKKLLQFWYSKMQPHNVNLHQIYDTNFSIDAVVPSGTIFTEREVITLIKTFRLNEEEVHLQPALTNMFKMNSLSAALAAFDKLMSKAVIYKSKLIVETADDSLRDKVERISVCEWKSGHVSAVVSFVINLILKEGVFNIFDKVLNSNQ